MSVIDYYQRQLESCRAQQQAGERLSLYYSRGRGAVFLATAVLFGQGWLSGEGRIWYWAGTVCAVGFLILITFHEQLLERLARLAARRMVNEQGIARYHRDWGGLPCPTLDIPPAFQPTAIDLDLFGDSSLFQLLTTIRTPVGRRVACDWIVAPATPETINARQRAVKQLAGEQELRESLQIEGLLLGDEGHVSESFLDWSDGPPWLSQKPWLIGLSRAIPMALVLTIALTVLRAISVELGLVVATALILANLAIIVLFAGHVHGLFTRINRGGRQVRRYQTMFELMYAIPDSDTELDAIKRRATDCHNGVRRAMSELTRISRLANIQHSALFFIFAYLPLQFLFLFDFHVLVLFERWQARHGSAVRDWFRALGEFEVLSALGYLLHDNPGWEFPEVRNDETQIVAQQLGHPLLRAEQRVANDVRLGPRGTVLLVTGSNMSGKSTLLRAIGLNAVLAQMGAPVCASSLRMPPVVIGTSIRVRDSLAAGVSFYMAELLRLRDLVAMAPAVEPEQPTSLLYLLDEILLGTNSKERQIAVVEVLRYLLARQTIGAITTHDLEMASSPEIASACERVHFRETIHPPGASRPITFDYRLRPGISTTTNALQLLKLVGLPDSRGSA